MTSYFYDIIKEAIRNDDQEAMKYMYALRYKDIRDWCEEQLDLADVPRGDFRDAFLREMFNVLEPDGLYTYIRTYCRPDPEEEKEEEEAEEDEDA